MQNGYSQPNVPHYRCIRADQVEAGTIGGLVYNDRLSGANEDMSNYWLKDTNVISAKRSYSTPTDPEWKPRSMTVRANS